MLQVVKNKQRVKDLVYDIIDGVWTKYTADSWKDAGKSLAELFHIFFAMEKNGLVKLLVNS